jgi:hypothetical protein
MTRACIVTGDIIGSTLISADKRKDLLEETADLLTQWSGDSAYASIFRGDSFQVLYNNIGIALKRSIQLRCWFKKHSDEGKALLDARMAIGVGSISYYGKSVLDSDGEAFHLSGRAFDKLEEGENFKIITPDLAINKQLEIILSLAENIMGEWTVNQAEVIYLLLEGKTQQQMADELSVGQSAVNNRLKLSKWKQIENMNQYIEALIGS